MTPRKGVLRLYPFRVASDNRRVVKIRIGFKGGGVLIPFRKCLPKWTSSVAPGGSRGEKPAIETAGQSGAIASRLSLNYRCREASVGRDCCGGRGWQCSGGPGKARSQEYRLPKIMTSEDTFVW